MPSDNTMAVFGMLVHVIRLDFLLTILRFEQGKREGMGVVKEMVFSYKNA